MTGPYDFAVINYTESSLTLFWRPPVSSSNTISFYQIEVFDKDGGFYKEKIVYFDELEEEILEELKPFEQYEIRLHSCSAVDLCSDPVTVYAATAPKGTFKNLSRHYSASRPLIIFLHF